MNTDPDCDDDDDSLEDCISDPVAIIPAKNLVIHENYSKSTEEEKSSYDIALITLIRPPRPSDVILNITLPEASMCNEDLVGPHNISGFGS